MLKYIIYITFFAIVNSQVDTLITVDASSYTDWIYLSIDQSSIVEIDDPYNSIEWDLAFNRKHIRTNSGLSGNGNGGAFVDSTITWIGGWDSAETLPENLFFSSDTVLNDFYDPLTHTFGEGIKNPVLNSWGWFDDDYHLNVTNYVFYVLLANGIDIIKFWPQNYYNQTGSGGHITLRYQTGFMQEEICEGMIGDINFDGTINVVDVVQLVSYVLNFDEIDSCQLLFSDINNDSQVNVVDIVNLVSIILSS